jgi:hypothetical protein
MKNLTLILAAGAVGALAVTAAIRAEAGALSGAEGIRVASNDASTLQNVQYGWRGYGGYGPAYGGSYCPCAYGSTSYPSAYGSTSYPYAYGSTSYPYAYGPVPDIHEQLGDGSIRRAGVGGYSDAAFGFGPTGSISDGR